VGLAQRVIEQAGIASVALSNVPELTAAVGVPRLVAVEYPFGQIMGKPGDRDGQTAVLREVLAAIEEMRQAGGVKHLPFAWTGPTKDLYPPAPPPLAVYLKRRPWQLPKLFSRRIPRK
jgi:hypothetical protein